VDADDADLLDAEAAAALLGRERWARLRRQGYLPAQGRRRGRLCWSKSYLRLRLDEDVRLGQSQRPSAAVHKSYGRTAPPLARDAHGRVVQLVARQQLPPPAATRRQPPPAAARPAAALSLPEEWRRVRAAFAALCASR
jgi:hypothetical protein